jgi:hypothetical protein
MNIRVILGLSLTVGLLGLYIYIQSIKSDLAAATRDRDKFKTAYDAAISNQNKNFEVSNDYQIQLAAVNRKLADALRVRERARCVPTITAGRPDAGTAAGEFPRRDGLSTDYLRDFAARCERTRLQLIGLQSWAGN